MDIKKIEEENEENMGKGRRGVIVKCVNIKVTVL